MTPSQIQELRELADAGQHRPFTVAEKAAVLIALRACAEREERALAGITDEVVATAKDAFFADYKARPARLWDDYLRTALQSAALALQGDRDAERWRHLRDGDCDMGDHHLVLARMYTGNNGEPELRCEVADYDEAIDAARAADLSRAIGDSNER